MDDAQPIVQTQRSSFLPTLRKFLLLLSILAVLFSFQIAHAQSETPNSKSTPTTAELINAVNALRIANGLHALTVNPVLMQIAQVEVGGIAAGNNGH
jgi:uncharacterized protein YkwD